MEDVLDLYAQPADPTVARICFDERPCQVVGDVLAPVPMQPGHSRKQDDEYQRHGVCSLLMAYDIDRGQRYLPMRDRRTKRDYAAPRGHPMHWLATTHYADVAHIQVVQDNLNTHTYGSCYVAFAAGQAQALKQKFDFHFTPKHASWLNMVEIELSAFARQCADQRLVSRTAFADQALAWADQRNREGVRIAWTFTTADARTKLRRHYLNLNSKN
jgi:hypothetical protein